MRTLFQVVLLAAALSAGFAAYAADSENGITVSAAWTRATAPGQDEAAVDLSISSGQAAELVGVSTPVARAGQLHRMTTEGGMMRMRQVKMIELPAGQIVNLGESGYHLMLVGLKAPLKEGAALPLTLRVKVGKKKVVSIEVKAEVRALTATDKEPSAGEHPHMDMPMEMK